MHFYTDTRTHTQQNKAALQTQRVTQLIYIRLNCEPQTLHPKPYTIQPKPKRKEGHTTST